MDSPLNLWRSRYRWSCWCGFWFIWFACRRWWICRVWFSAFWFLIRWGGTLLRFDTCFMSSIPKHKWISQGLHCWLWLIRLVAARLDWLWSALIWAPRIGMFFWFLSNHTCLCWSPYCSSQYSRAMCTNPALPDTPSQWSHVFPSSSSNAKYTHTYPYKSPQTQRNTYQSRTPSDCQAPILWSSICSPSTGLRPTLPDQKTPLCKWRFCLRTWPLCTGPREGLKPLVSAGIWTVRQTCIRRARLCILWWILGQCKLWGSCYRWIPQTWTRTVKIRSCHSSWNWCDM